MLIGCDEYVCDKCVISVCVTCSAREAVRADCTESKGLFLRGLTSAPPFTSNRLPRPRVEVEVLLLVVVEEVGLFSDATTDNDVAAVDAEEEEGVWWGLRSRERVAMMSPRRL